MREVVQQAEPDPRELIGSTPMSGAQKRVVALAAILSALDGFDILSITFVAPILGHVFGLGSGALGLLLSSGLIGALIGSVTLGALADTIGRRPVVLISLVTMGLGMLAAAMCSTLTALAIVRVVTGIGIGAMVVVINPITVEVSNVRSRSFAISMMSVGYPLGGMAGGLISAALMRLFDWRSVFLFGAIVALALLPLMLWMLPESLTFLIERRNEKSLNAINRLLKRFGHAPLGSLPLPTAQPAMPYRRIFQGAQLRTTAFVSVISFLVFVAIYFYLSWQPKLLVDMGFSPSKAATIASTSSLAGACGTALFGFLSRRFNGLRLAIVSIVGLASAIFLFGVAPSFLPLLVGIAMLAGASLAASTVGLYVIAADAFPATMRSTGTGFMIGVGRLGTAIAPTITGGLFGLGLGRAGVCIAIAACALIAATMLLSAPRLTRALSIDVS